MSMRSTLVPLLRNRASPAHAGLSRSLLNNRNISALPQVVYALQSPSGLRFMSSLPDDDSGKKRKSRKSALDNGENGDVAVGADEKAAVVLAKEDSSLALPPKRTIAFFVAERPLLPDCVSVVTGNEAMLKALLKSLQEENPSPVCVFFVPRKVQSLAPKNNLDPELPQIGSSAKLNFVTINTPEKTYLVLENGEVLINNMPTQMTIEEVLTEIDGAKVSKWQAGIVATSFVERASRVSMTSTDDVPFVDVKQSTQAYGVLDNQDEVQQQEFEKAWGDLRKNVAHFFPHSMLPISSWKLICCHILAVFQSVPGAEIQRIMDCTDPVECIKITNRHLEKEYGVISAYQNSVGQMHNDQEKQASKQSKMELVRRIQKELDNEQDKSAIFKNRLKKFDEAMQALNQGNLAEGSTEAGKTLYDQQKEQEEKEDEEFWQKQLEAGGAPLSIPIKVRRVIDDELAKFETLEKNSGEYHPTRNYLDWLTSIPWGRTTADTFDVAKTQQILDEEHYALDDVKKRILEFVAVSKLKNSAVSSGKIICLVGPPGVGKTSIGKSVAKALGRKFYRFSVGGMFDVAEIKGHRRTYVGSMPGKLVQMYKSLGTTNPLMMIDEIDKIGHGNHHGDPSSALLELLDPSQNTSFVDHYLDVPVDASKVMFLCTANSLSSIKGPLRDRLEIIEVSGYDAVEKVQIAKTYLEPKLRNETGLDMDSFAGLSDDAFHALSKDYSRESGVRQLERMMDKIYRKVALEVVQSGQPVGQLEQTELESYVGKSKYSKERLFGDSIPAGVVMGLAYNGEGGMGLYVEATSVKEYPSDGEDSKGSRGSIASTGNLGDTMKESVNLAYYNAKRESGSDYFNRNEVKLHVPHGGIPKDGPSAGITMTMTMLSLAWDAPIDPFMAMTGEVTLTGRVLPVGGIKEKVLAAKRLNINKLIIPDGNRKDWEDLADHLREGVEIHFVSDIQSSIPLVFPDHAHLSKRSASSATQAS